MRKGILLGLGAGLLVLSSCGFSKPTLVQAICEDLPNGYETLTYFWSDGSRDFWIDVYEDKRVVCAHLPEEDVGTVHTHYPPKP